MIPKFKAYLKNHEKIVSVVDINYKYKEVVYESEKYMEVESFKDVELLQFTGLKDKNDVDIFENNIVNVHEFINVGGIEGYEEGEKETIGIIKYGCLYDSPIPEWYL